MQNLSELVVLIKGGGEMASAVAHRLHRSHLKVCLTELPRPLAVSRGTAFSEAVFDGVKTIEGVTAELALCKTESLKKVWEYGNIPIIIDTRTRIRHQLKPDVVIDAISAKKNTGTRISDAPLVIGLGPGFYAGKDVHVVIETNHDNNLGRVILEGKAREDTRTPVTIGGLAAERVVWAASEGLFNTKHEIGDSVEAHQVIAQLGELPLEAPVKGIIRGLLRDGVRAPQNAKLIEIDPVNDKAVCYAIRDKWRAVAGGVLKAIMLRYNTLSKAQPGEKPLSDRLVAA